MYLNIRLKVYQGTIRCNCALHANSNFQPPQSDALSNCCPSTKPVKCLYSSGEFHKILLDSLSINSRHCYPTIASVIAAPSSVSSKPIDVVVQQHQKPIATTTTTTGKVKPRISINLTLTDAENDNVCMCALYASTSDDNDFILIDAARRASMDGKICSQCRHIIKQQPTEHRKALISKRLELENDIIVNRVDTHYLSLCTYPGKYGDPYTPESVESHSPVPEAQDESISLLEINQNSSATLNEGDHHLMSKSMLQQTTVQSTSATAASKAVSPSQLKSRLKSLQRPVIGGGGVITHKDSHSCSSSVDVTKDRNCLRCGLCDIL